MPRVPGFVSLMQDHIRSARKVVRGKFSNKKMLTREGLSGLAKNTQNWGKAIKEVTGSSTKASTFQKLWGDHVKLEGDYIGAVWGCKCDDSIGKCMNAKKAHHVLKRLKKNGKQITQFLGHTFKHKGKWDELWAMHLHCVQRFIDLAKRVDCGLVKISTFDASVKSCITKGNKFGRMMERSAKKYMEDN